MHPAQLSIQDYNYHLPTERIAAYPLPSRDDSKLLIYKDHQISHDHYRNIAQHLPADAYLVFNNTRVVAARLLFQKPTGGMIEIFCLEPDERYPDITTAMAQTGNINWQCLVGGASKWKHGQVLEKKIIQPETIITLYARYQEKTSDAFNISFSWSPASLSFAEVLNAAGSVPLPPYIKRPAMETDKETYQTIYAEQEGSVAAPTAGLHFTKNIFTSLEKKNIQWDFVTLHVGAGTFKPVKSAVMKDHEMHAEFLDVSLEVIKRILSNLENNVIAVGTTSLRTIESLYWLGLKLKEAPAEEIPFLEQWEPYERNVPPDFSAEEALTSLVEWMSQKKLSRIRTKTRLMIAPGYLPRIAKGLITNFHQPSSTLLLLVAALIGNDWRKVYDYALENDFRFLSYGDGSLLWFN